MANKHKYTATEVRDALLETFGAVYLAADKLGCSYNTVYNYIDRHPSVRAAYEHEDGKTTDAAEVALRRAILNGEAWAIKYRLSTKGKGRGYTERQEHTGKDGDPIAFVNVDTNKL